MDPVITEQPGQRRPTPPSSRRPHDERASTGHDLLFLLAGLQEGIRRRPDKLRRRARDRLHCRASWQLRLLRCAGLTTGLTTREVPALKGAGPSSFTRARPGDMLGLPRERGYALSHCGCPTEAARDGLILRGRDPTRHICLRRSILQEGVGPRLQPAKLSRTSCPHAQPAAPLEGWHALRLLSPASPLVRHP